MSAGNIRMNNVNMNKYDAAQTMNAGTSSRLSMDHQQTASNQSSVRTGTENIHSDKDTHGHEGSTWITDRVSGKSYEVNGEFKQVGGGWTGSGTINEYDNNGNYIGSYQGVISGTGDMSDYHKNTVQGGRGGREDAFVASSVISTNLDASNVKHEDNISTANKIEQNNDIKEAKKVEDYSKLKDTSDVTKNNIINENNKIEQNNNIKEAKTVDDTSTTINNSTNISTGTQYKGVAQAAMGKTEDFEKMMTRLADMKQAVLNGDMSAKEFQAEVRNFSGAYAQEMSSFLSKTEQDSWGTNVKGSAGASGQVRVDSKDQVAGKVASAVTGVSYSGDIHAGIELGISRDDRTQSAQNLIAKEMYDTIMQSGNVNDMVNNASNLANKHADTNLSGIDMAMNEIPKAVDGLKEKAGNFSEQHLDRILK